MKFKDKIRIVLSKVPGFRWGYRLLWNFLLKANGFTYDFKDVTSKRNTAFLKEPDYVRAYERAKKQYGEEDFNLFWALHINQWAAFYAKNLTGDFVECGVFKGTHAMSNMVYIDFQSMPERKYYLFDTYCGMDKQLASAKEIATFKGVYTDTYDFVVQSFKDFPNVVIVKGTVPKTLGDVNIKDVAYLHLDMNCAIPEAEAIKFFWPKIVPFGIIILDDYAWIGHEDQKKVMDEFARAKGVKILSLPTGQGLLIKPGDTSTV